MNTIPQLGVIWVMLVMMPQGIYFDYTQVTELFYLRDFLTGEVWICLRKRLYIETMS